MEKEHIEVLLEDIGGKLQLLAEGHVALVERFDRMDVRFERLETRFDRLEIEMRSGFADVDARFDHVDARFDHVDARFDELIGFVADGRDDHDARLKKLERRRR
jgi:predicted nuclease with TOPRIM domain